MKKNLILSFVLSTLLSLVSVSLSAQNDKFAVEPLSEKLQEKSSEIISLMTTNPDKGNNKCLKLLKRKNAIEYASLGRLFLDKKLYPFAKICADQAYKEDHLYLPGLMLSVDVYSNFGTDGLGKAGQRLDEILLLLPDDKNIIYKSAMIYRKVNPEVAKEKLIAIKKIDPSFTLADKDLAEISYDQNDIKNAISYYEAYFKEEPNASFDSKCNYAICLYINKQFDKSLAEVEKLLKIKSDVLSLSRMKMYNLIDQERYDEGTVAAESFFTQFSDSLRNAYDYWYLGRLQNKTSKYVEAINNFNTSIDMMTKNPKNKNIEVYSSLADAYNNLNDYDKSISTYKKYLGMKDRMTNIDYFYLGKKYYYAASDTNVNVQTRKNYIISGDSLFAHVTKIAEDSYLGPYWQAKINTLSSPNVSSDTVKYFYEKTLERLKASPNIPVEMECYQYITIYFVQKNDYKSAYENNEVALTIDPKNAVALKFKNALKTILEK